MGPEADYLICPRSCDRNPTASRLSKGPVFPARKEWFVVADGNAA